MIDWNNDLDEIFASSWPVPDPFRIISNKKIVLYGAGSMGLMAIELMRNANLEPSYIIDKVKTGYIDGVKIIDPVNIPEIDKTSAAFIICIATIPVGPIYDYLKSIGCDDIRHFYDYSEMIFPDDMPNGWFIKDIERSKIEGILKSLEHDDYSVAHYLQFLWWRMRRKEVLYTEYPVLSGRKYFKAPCMPQLSKKERFLDGGAHYGQSIESFLHCVSNEFERIWAFEPDMENLRILKKRHNHKKIDLYGKALSSINSKLYMTDGLGFASKLDEKGNKKVSSVTIDSLDIKPSIIKLHIEGSELDALNGAKSTIENNRPLFMVMADHGKEGLYDIPLFLSQMSFYRIFFYLHDFCGNSAVYYAIPIGAHDEITTC